MDIKTVLSTCTPFLQRLEALYGRMDREYNRIAGLYGFDCRGCTDNCCHTLFYNHTYLEYCFLIKGLAELSDEKQKAVVDRAVAACAAIEREKTAGKKPRVLCPLNENGLCGMHGHRLMICRLHGIPYDLHTPGRPPFRGSGCFMFEKKCGSAQYIVFDRTPFYLDLSELELEFRQATGLGGKFKMTIAEMVAGFGTGRAVTQGEAP